MGEIQTSTGIRDQAFDALRWLLDFQWSHDISLGMARWLFMAFFAAIVLLVVRMKRDYVYQGAPDQGQWRDLRIWGLLVMAIQIGLYLYF